MTVVNECNNVSSPSLASTPPTTLDKEALLNPQTGGCKNVAAGFSGSMVFGAGSVLGAEVGAEVEGGVGGSVGRAVAKPARGQHTCTKYTLLQCLSN